FFNGTGRGFQRGNTTFMRQRQVTPQIFDLVGGTYALAGFPLWRRSLAKRSLSLVKENASRRRLNRKIYLSKLKKIKRLVFDCRRGFHFCLDKARRLLPSAKNKLDIAKPLSTALLFCLYRE
ncbi:MAG: hypothetical protein K5917_00250, partial [Clostridiales bacterium]|nr:hypothetical protein [Clostridiales bacterium]